MTKETNPPAGDDTETKDAHRRAVLAQPHTVQAFRPPSVTVKVDIAAASHRGLSRDHNDDHFLVARTGRSQETLATSLSAAELPVAFQEYAYAMVVADGLGDAGTGSVASRVALSSLAHIALHHGQWNVRVDPETAMEIIDRAQYYFSRVDAEVFAKSLTGPLLSGIATSLTLAYSAGESLFVAHVGHSRAYLFRNGALTLLTRDHTMERHLAGSKGPIPVERRAQDMGHILTDAVGAGGGAPLVDVEQFRLVNGDTVLLCTNGLTDTVEEGQIADVLARPRQPAEQCAILTDLAYQRRGEDDVTVVLAQYHVPAP